LFVIWCSVLSLQPHQSWSTAETESGKGVSNLDVLTHQDSENKSLFHFAWMEKTSHTSSSQKYWDALNTDIATGSGVCIKRFMKRSAAMISSQDTTYKSSD
jgi:hypothetical protein